MDNDTGMSTNQQPGVRRIQEALANLWSRVSLRIVCYGVALVLAGYALQTGVWAGMLPIWGAALILVGLSAYSLTWYTYR